MEGLAEALTDQLAAIPGVVAVTLGGSRAQGAERPGSDWDFGLYYQGSIRASDVAALGYEGQITEPGGWGPVVNGGAWLTVGSERVDLCYRELAEVEHWVAQADAGHFRIESLPTHVAGIPTYVLAGELALGRVLSGRLARPTFSAALAAKAPPRWRQLASMALLTARAHAERRDTTAAVADLGVAVLQEAHARMAERGQWVLNEKGLVGRAALRAAHRHLAQPGRDRKALADTVERIAALIAPPG